MGLQADRCIKPDQVEEKLKWLINTDGPALLEVVTDKKVGLFPMVSRASSTSSSAQYANIFQVPAGRALHEILVYDAGRICKNALLIKADMTTEKERVDHATRLANMSQPKRGA